MIDGATIGRGDMVQLRELNNLYNKLLYQKFLYIEKVGHEWLNTDGVAEANLRLAMITGELKRVDGLRTSLVTGEIIPGEHEALRLDRMYKEVVVIYDDNKSRKFFKELSELKVQYEILERRHNKTLLTDVALRAKLNRIKQAKK